jgi:D-tyrosyl-tRNA(Tyr) deacylase
MRVVVQRSGKAKLKSDGKDYSSIDRGLMLLVGFTEGDGLDEIKWMVNKIVNLRIFDDEEGVMNKSILDVGGEILSVSQFTLYGDCKKGSRPSYIKALNGDKASPLYDKFNEELSRYVKVSTGVYGSDMEINFTNIGPVTIIIEK